MPELKVYPHKNPVWCEFGPNGEPIRIFRSERACFDQPHKTGTVYATWPRKEAVASIRHQIFIRSKGHCEKCGEIVTETTGQMHEVKPRGIGGEISIDNSQFICYSCHSGEHKNRTPQFRKD